MVPVRLGPYPYNPPACSFCVSKTGGHPARVSGSLVRGCSRVVSQGGGNFCHSWPGLPVIPSPCIPTPPSCQVRRAGDGPSARRPCPPPTTRLWVVSVVCFGGGGVVSCGCAGNRCGAPGPPTTHVLEEETDPKIASSRPPC